MSIIKSFSVYCGDMFYIKHNSDNFTIIDCNLSDRNEKRIVDELISESAGKEITRFISTHPDEDHLCGLKYINERMGIRNFYCVKNNAKKVDPSKDFKEYCKLRDSDKSFHIKKGCSRKWMNQSGDGRGSSGINILWPDPNNADYKEVLAQAENRESPNNTSAILKYSLENGVNVLWMGDLEKDFMEKIENEVNWSEVDILFAPHHGRKSGKVPKSILDKLNPKIVVIGQAPTENIDYYNDFDTMTQNSTGDMIFDCESKNVHIHVSEENYKVDFLSSERPRKFDGYNYIGTLKV